MEIIQKINEGQTITEYWLRNLSMAIYYGEGISEQQRTENMAELQKHCQEINRPDIYNKFQELQSENARMRAIQDNRGNGSDVEFSALEEFREDHAELPAFNPDWLPVAYKKFALEVAESYQVPVDMVAMTEITAFSAVLSHKVCISPKPDFIESPNLYTAIIAAPSEKKSPILKEITRPFYEYQEQENERLRPIIEQQRREKRIQDKRKKALEDALVNDPADTESAKELEEMKPLKQDHFIQLVAMNVTMEKLVDLLSDQDERMAIFSAEGEIFKIIAGLYSREPNAGILLQGYSGEHYDLQRKNGSDQHLKHPLITILTMIQPVVVKKLFKSDELSQNGTTARFAYILPETSIGVRRYDTRPVSRNAREGYANGITDWLRVPVKDQADIVKLDQGAQELAKTFFDALETIMPTLSESAQQWYGKAFGQCMRVALVLHCMNAGTAAVFSPVNESIMQSAIDIETYIAAHTMAVMESAGATRTDAERVALYVKKRIETVYTDYESVDMQDLWQSCRNRQYDTIEKLRKGINELERRQYIKVIKEQGVTGRPKEIVLINPEWRKAVSKSVT